MAKKKSVLTLQEMKNNGEKITMVTSYDYAMASLAEQAGVDTILVGDSLQMVVLGDDSTISATLDTMIHHIKAVVKGAPNTFVIGDMPFGSYHISPEEAVASAVRMMKEGRCDAVKMEGGVNMEDTIRAIVDAGIPVCAHIGLTPQTTAMLGGHRVQGRGDAAQKVLDDALAVQRAGAFMVVFECVPGVLAEHISKLMNIPVIGIGAGAGTDGQVLVFHDILGLSGDFKAKFVKKFRDLGAEAVAGIGDYVKEVKEGTFPAEENTFGGVSEEDLENLKEPVDIRGGLKSIKDGLKNLVPGAGKDGKVDDGVDK